MFLTLFYMIATWVKFWQLRAIKTKLLEHISTESAVALYKIPDNIEGEFTLILRKFIYQY